MKESLAKRFCGCIKKVRNTVKVSKKQKKESAAIAICVKSVPHSRNKTLKRFSGKNGPYLKTQPKNKE